MGTMMPTPRLWGVLLCGALFQGCWDETESPATRPPDLRMEDVVGCWTDGDPYYCRIMCFDPNGYEWFQDNSESGALFESVGSFTLFEWKIRSQVKFRSQTSKIDSSHWEIAYRRVGPDLYTLTPELQLATRFTPVNLDSTLPCGTPFQLLPKPAGWTLF